MSNKYKIILIFTASAFFSFFLFFQPHYQRTGDIKLQKEVSSSSPKAPIEMKKGRDEYFFNMLRDPKTNKIPPSIRQKEIEFAKKLNEKNASLNKFSLSELTWVEAGPNDVGGRTRALAVDITNPDIIIAGGASGGIWKSIDKGATWTLKSSSSTILSVSSIAQDPRSGFTNNWYYTTGERYSNGAGGGGTFFTGDGIYKSSDNGETWNVLPSTLSLNITGWESPFDYVDKIIVSPTTGNLFVASYGYGIFRSTNGGNSFELVLGGDHIHSDVTVATNGNLLAVLSRAYPNSSPQHTPGLYKSANGEDWTDITPSTYQSTFHRSSICIAPSNPDVAYMLTWSGEVIPIPGTNRTRDVVKFYKINIGAGTSEDRSNNLPNFMNEDPFSGFYTTQGGYDVIVAVKPDNENFVLIGGTNLFRSSDGFATQPTSSVLNWIGGYNPQTFFYPGLHPDVHSFAFDPMDPKKMWWGHDGGLSYTADITNTSYNQFFPWENKNNGYNVTQFYHIAIKDNSSDSRIMGGTQDNGTPYLVYNGSTSNHMFDASSGDGSFSYFGQNFAYTSTQNGSVKRLRYDNNNNILPPFTQENNPFAVITPMGATNQLFINPFVVDPNNEDVMYYPAGAELWRNNQLSSIPDGSNGTSIGWTKLDNLTLQQGYVITALSISKNPAHVLYYGAMGQDVPKIYRLSNSATSISNATDISIPNAAPGSYIIDIAINPDNSDEILVTLSNYNVIGIYHSTNGGQLYTAVEGNLEGSQQNPGPSLRGATILPGIGYYLATSVGVFSTITLNGNSTTWTQEGQNVIGNVIVSCITSRKSDGRVVAGTHGRGAFVGSAGSSGAAQLNVNVDQLNIEVQPGLTRTKEFIISNPGGSNLSFSINASGGEVNEKIIPTADLPKSSLLHPVKISSNINEKNLSKFRSEINKNPDFQTNNNESYSPLSVDELILDDGNALPDAFFGAALQGYHFYWANHFVLDKDFALEKIRFHMKTESASSNLVGIEVQSSNGTILFSTSINTDLSTTGKWYEFDIPQNELSNLTFSNGESFYIVIASLNSTLTFPAGYDDDGLKPGHSYWAYYEVASGYWSGYVLATGNTAWLVRAVGNSGGAQNQNPVAVAQVSPNPAQLNQTVNFNGQGSYDNDGQINQYSWVFGDGNTSNQMNETHSYSQAGQYNYSLTVTDNLGATNQTGGQITVTDEASRWTINPSNGTVSPGGQQSILVTYDASGLPEGNYTGQISVTSNGGNTNIPVTILVSNSVDVTENTEIKLSYSLEQNYPNPFNPTTTIRWHLAEAGLVNLKVYDITGEEVASLINDFKPAGSYETVFDVYKLKKSLTSGVYIYKLQAGDFIDTKKFILIK